MSFRAAFFRRFFGWSAFYVALIVGISIFLHVFLISRVCILLDLYFMSKMRSRSVLNQKEYCTKSVHVQILYIITVILIYHKLVLSTSIYFYYYLSNSLFWKLESLLLMTSYFCGHQDTQVGNHGVSLVLTNIAQSLLQCECHGTSFCCAGLFDVTSVDVLSSGMAC